MKLPFTQKHIEFTKKIKVPFDIDKELSADEICDLGDIVADYLMTKTLDEDYAPNEEGVICYEILDILGDT